MFQNYLLRPQSEKKSIFLDPREYKNIAANTTSCK